MYKIQPEDNVVLVTDGINYDNLCGTGILLANPVNIKAICSTHGWSSVGYSIEPLNNLLVATLRYGGVKFYAGSVMGYPDQEYNTYGLFSNFIDQEENSLIDNMYGGRSLLTNVINMYQKLTDTTDITVKDMSEVDGDKYAFYEYARSLPNLVIISLGPMTDVEPLKGHYKALLQQGGRLYNANRSIELPRVNPSASSNLYLDPIAARSNLVSSSEKIWWIMSETVIPVLTTSETAERIRNLETNNPMYNVFLQVLAIYYQGMADIDLILPFSDVTVIMLALYPELSTEVAVRSVDINDKFDLQYTQTTDTIVSTVTYDKTIGSMIDGPYTTNLITAIDGEAMASLFYKVLAPVFPPTVNSNTNDSIAIVNELLKSKP